VAVPQNVTTPRSEFFVPGIRAPVLQRWPSTSSSSSSSFISFSRGASSLPLAPRIFDTPFAVTMNPAMLARNPVVLATAARPRGAARRASAAAVTKARGLVARANYGTRRRATRCAASESDSNKTVSALDAILAGSQDEPAPEEVRA